MLSHFREIILRNLKEGLARKTRKIVPKKTTLLSWERKCVPLGPSICWLPPCNLGLEQDLLKCDGKMKVQQRFLLNFTKNTEAKVSSLWELKLFLDECCEKLGWLTRSWLSATSELASSWLVLDLFGTYICSHRNYRRRPTVAWLATRDDTNITQTSLGACKRLSRFERAVRFSENSKANFIFLRDGGRREHMANVGKCNVWIVSGQHRSTENSKSDYFWFVIEDRRLKLGVN